MSIFLQSIRIGLIATLLSACSGGGQGDDQNAPSFNPRWMTLPESNDSLVCVEVFVQDQETVDAALAEGFEDQSCSSLQQNSALGVCEVDSAGIAQTNVRFNYYQDDNLIPQAILPMYVDELRKDCEFRLQGTYTNYYTEEESAEDVVEEDEFAMISPSMDMVTQRYVLSQTNENVLNSIAVYVTSITNAHAT